MQPVSRIRSVSVSGFDLAGSILLVGVISCYVFFFSSRRRHTRSVSAFLLNRSSDLEGTLQAGTSAVSDKLLDLVGLGGKSAADKGKDTRDYLAAAFPELNAWERAGADASSAGMVDAGFEN